MILHSIKVVGDTPPQSVYGANGSDMTVLIQIASCKFKSPAIRNNKKGRKFLTSKKQPT